jgi:hypothetical protein
VRALALDPGGTTGFAAVYLRKSNGLTLRTGEKQFSPSEIYAFLADFTDTCRYDEGHVIYEDFHYRNASRAGLDLTPVKLIGIIELYKERYESSMSFTSQTAAIGKGYWTDLKLKEKGIYAKGKPHGRDATRHLMYWLAFGAGSKYVNVDHTEIEFEVI